MRLRDLDIFFVEPPPPGWGGRYWCIVKLISDDGIFGYGEVYAAAVGPEAMRAVIEDVFARHMLDQPVQDIEFMFRRAYSAGFTQRPDPTVIGAFSGLEIACWDLIGKARDVPVHAMLGGAINREVRSYSYLYPSDGEEMDGFWFDPDRSANRAAAMVEEGFTALKFDPAGPYTIRGGHQPAMSDIDLSVKFCARIREAVGRRADLLFGTHGQFTAAGAIRLARCLEPFDPLWFEEPVPPDNVDDLAQVARATRVPVAVGERLTTKAEFGAVLRRDAAAILQPALGRAGGIWEGKKIASMAEAFNVQIAPHLYAGPVEWAASIQLAATLPNLLLVETIGTGSGFQGQLIGHQIRWQDGFIEVPTAPGLGIAFDEDLARANPYRGERLHLEAQDAPCNYREANRFTGGAPPRS